MLHAQMPKEDKPIIRVPPKGDHIRMPPDDKPGGGKPPKD